MVNFPIQSYQNTVDQFDKCKGGRLYQRLARRLLDDIAAGTYAIGHRLPAERELAIIFETSRPTVREAVIALEVLGYVRVQIGAGAYVCQVPGAEQESDFSVTAFELIEAQVIFESEAAAVAATKISDAEIGVLGNLVDTIISGNSISEATEIAVRDFHLAVATATRNSGVVRTIEGLWHRRSALPECQLLFTKARSANRRPIGQEFTKIIEAFRTRNAAGASEWMRTHLTSIMDYLLFSSEEKVIEEARIAFSKTRQRYNSWL